ncbi:hypothetical protein BJ912DRAFT_983024 [Pholiota molesta]|nr:hypothetical protein BJ912DRAFT_983024 [Pholiota molesta]
MESLASEPTLESPANEDRSASSASAQDQTLLRALQDLIVRVMDPKQTNDTNLIPSGPEAEKLIIALQEFISGIILGSRSKAPNTKIEVDLPEEDKELRRSDLEDDEFPDGESVLVGHGGSAYDGTAHINDLRVIVLINIVFQRKTNFRRMLSKIINFRVVVMMTMTVKEKSKYSSRLPLDHPAM